MKLGSYLEVREGWRAEAPLAAAELRADDPRRALSLVAGWGSDPAHGELILRVLRQHPPAPAPGAMAMALAPLQALDPTLGASSVTQWRQLMAGRSRSGDAGLAAVGSQADPLVWGLAELAAAAWLTDTQLRQPWTAPSAVVVPHLDHEVGLLWSAWGQGRPWDVREAWDGLFLGPALRSFAAVLQGRQLSVLIRKRALADAREGFFYALVGDGGLGAGWREVAVRLIEASGGDPVDALAHALPPQAWPRVAQCCVTRGHRRETASLVWGSTVSRGVQARELCSQGQARPERLRELLDLHLALRLVHSWTSPEHTGPESSLSVVQHNIGRARSRLRAVLREAPAGHLLAHVTALPGLADRSAVAVARFARDWAWQQVQCGFSFHDARTLDPACESKALNLPDWTEDDQALLRAWVLLVILKGRLSHLQQWVYGGTRVDRRDTTWGRLLSEGCPEQLRAYPGASRREGLARLRVELSERLRAVLPSLGPVLDRVAALDQAHRALGPAFDDALAPVWHPELPLPRVRYRQFIVAATTARAELVGSRGVGTNDENA